MIMYVCAHQMDGHVSYSRFLFLSLLLYRGAVGENQRSSERDL